RINQGLLDGALTAYDDALAMDRDCAEAWFGRGKAFREKFDYAGALDAFERAAARKPDLPFLEGARLAAKLYLCDWSNLEAEIAHWRKAVREGKPVVEPFTYQAISPSAAEQLAGTQVFVQHTTLSTATSRRPSAHSHPKIRVAYLSGEFYDHAVAQLTIGVYEAHDRTNFDVTAISTSVGREDAMRQ